MSAKLKIKTITPIHIGKGNTIGSFEYHYQSGKFYRLNTSKALDFIVSEHPDAINKIDAWVEGKIDAMGNGGQAKANYRLNLFDFVKSFKNKELENKFRDNLSKFSKYVIQSNADPAGKDVSELLKTADDKVYIPGSTIKGMIRNALLNDFILNADKSNKDKIINIIKESLLKPANDFSRKHFADALQHLVFGCGFDKFDYSKKQLVTEYSDAKFDLMKFIKINDTNSVEVDDSCLLTKPTMVTRAGKKQEQANYLECVAPDKSFKSNVIIDIDYLKFIANKYPYLEDKGKRIWIDFDKKVKTVFGISIEELKTKETSSIEDTIINHIYDALYKFSEGIYNSEVKISSLMEKVVNIDQYVNHINCIFDNNASIPCKLGWGSGFPATTIFTNFFEGGGFDTDENRKLFENVMTKFGIGKTPGKQAQNRPYNANIDKFPASRKYEIDGKRADAFGWIELTIE